MPICRILNIIACHLFRLRVWKRIGRVALNFDYESIASSLNRLYTEGDNIQKFIELKVIGIINNFGLPVPPLPS